MCVGIAITTMQCTQLCMCYVCTRKCIYYTFVYCTIERTTSIWKNNFTPQKVLKIFVKILECLWMKCNVQYLLTMKKVFLERSPYQRGNQQRDQDIIDSIDADKISALKVHKREIFYGSDFEIFTFSQLLMHKW